MHLKVGLVIFSICLLLNPFWTLAYLTKSRVIGGQKVSRNQFPYQVSVQLNNRHWCGGAIIDRSWIVTAAHCFHLNLEKLTILAGVYDFEMKDMNSQRRNIVIFYKHEEYKGGVGADDIALVKIDKEFELNNLVKVINLPKDDIYPTGKALLSGWGSITDTKQPEYPTALHSTFLPIHTPKTCFSLWKMSSIIHKTICAGTLDASRLTCSGDSGSPLVQLETDGKLKLIGIVSGGACGVKNKPSIFVRVSYYKDWISGVLYRHL